MARMMRSVVVMCEKTLAGYSNGEYDHNVITGAEAMPFQRKIGILLSEEECSDLISYLSEHPNAGLLVQARKDGAGPVPSIYTQIA